MVVEGPASLAKEEMMKMSLRMTLGLGVALSLALPCQALVIDDGVVIGGDTYYPITGEWMKWALGYPSSTSPMLDTDGSRAHLGDQASVFFLAGSFLGDPVTRTFNVPTGKPLFFPVANSFAVQDNPGDTESSLRAIADPANVLAYWATLDGVSLSSSAVRMASPLVTLNSELLPGEFGLCYPAACPSGYTGMAVTDGYWLTLAPLAPGPHQIKFGAIFNDGGSLDITANVNAVPEPGTYALMLAGLGLVGWAASRRRNDR
jgi:hypothetical protein